jgi:hypothetical protein
MMINAEGIDLKSFSKDVQVKCDNCAHDHMHVKPGYDIYLNTIKGYVATYEDISRDGWSNIAPRFSDACAREAATWRANGGIGRFVVRVIDCPEERFVETEFYVMTSMDSEPERLGGGFGGGCCPCEPSLQ